MPQPYPPPNVIKIYIILIDDFILLVFNITKDEISMIIGEKFKIYVFIHKIHAPAPLDLRGFSQEIGWYFFIRPFPHENVFYISYLVYTFINDMIVIYNIMFTNVIVMC